MGSKYLVVCGCCGGVVSIGAVDCGVVDCGVVDCGVVVVFELDCLLTVFRITEVDVVASLPLAAILGFLVVVFGSSTKVARRGRVRRMTKAVTLCFFF